MKTLILILLTVVLLLSISCTRFEEKISYGVIHEVYEAERRANPNVGIIYKVKVIGEPEYRTVTRYIDIHTIGDTLKLVERVRIK